MTHFSVTAKNIITIISNDSKLIYFICTDDEDRQYLSTTL